MPGVALLGCSSSPEDGDTYPCSSPTVPGDGLMPFGEVGGRHNVYSQDLGTVLAGPDTISFWQDAFDAGLGQTGTKADDTVVFFTQRTSLRDASGTLTRVDPTWISEPT